MQDGAKYRAGPVKSQRRNGISLEQIREFLTCLLIGLSAKNHIVDTLQTHSLKMTRESK